MKGVCLIVLVALAGHFAFCREQLAAKIPVRTRLINQKSSKIPKERRLNFDDELQTGSLYAQQLENTNANLNEMTGHSRLQSSMKKVGEQFSQIQENLDDFRDAVSRKLNELHMSLQRPKIPIMGPAAMMLHPSMNPIIPNTLNGPNSNFMPNASSNVGYHAHSEFYNPITNGNHTSNAVMRNSVGSVNSSFQNSGMGRKLLQVTRGSRYQKVL